MVNAVKRHVNACFVLVALSTMSADADLINLGTFGGTMSQAEDINESGQVVGTAYNAAGDPRPFLYENGVLTDLGTLGGPRGFGEAINNHGTAVGQSNHSSAIFDSRVSVFAGGGVSTFGPGEQTRGYAINDNGDIAGFNFTTNRAFVETAGGTTILEPVVPGLFQSLVSDINASGQLAAGAYANGLLHAFLYDSGTFTTISTLGGSFASSAAINDHGHVVGFSEDGSGFSRGFLFKDGATTAIPEMGSARRYQQQGLDRWRQEPPTLR